MKHIINAQQFDIKTIQQLFERTHQIQRQFKTPVGRVCLQQKLANKLLFNIFYEPSTRTRLSFAAAAHHLGMRVIETENAREFSSAIKGESLEDSIRVLCGYYPDAIVLRHHQNGAAEKAAAVSTVPILNAGDGDGQHPTQSLLDLYTIWSKLRRLDNLTILIGGDLAYGRTGRSLVYLLSKFPGTKFIFYSLPELQMGNDIKAYLLEKKVPYQEVFDDINPYFQHADVVYWTRIQKERHTEHRLGRAVEVIEDERYHINIEQMDLMKPTAILMHPLPRNKEISTDVDHDPRSVYLKPPGFGGQTENGLYIRMALLDWVLDGNDRL